MFTAIVVVTVVIIALVVAPIVGRVISASDDGGDYSGGGTGSATVTIKSGDTGETIAKNLQKQHIVKSSKSFYQSLLQVKPAPVFQPGVWKLKSKMSNKAALAALQNIKNLEIERVTIVEGHMATQIFASLSKATGIQKSEFETLNKQPGQFGLPAEAKTLEGFLFPATYEFQPGTSAKDIISTLVKRSIQALDSAGVAPADRYRVTTLASIVQRESGSAADMGKVARVFQNRLDKGMTLGSDATIAYGIGQFSLELPKSAYSDASNAYNTRVHQGLPPGPISSPGDDAIKGAVHPTDGPWLYFVTVNPDTGETKFATTDAEFQQYSQEYQEWLKQHPQH